MKRVLLCLYLITHCLAANAGEAMIQSCSDGDTCSLQASGFSFKVRLIGVDAPETGRKKGSGQPFAQEAKDALNRMVAGKRLQVVQMGLDAYNRPLVTIRLESGESANERLVIEGLAEVYEARSKFDVSSLLEAQARAKRDRRGVWSLGQGYISPAVYRKRVRLAEAE